MARKTRVPLRGEPGEGVGMTNDPPEIELRQAPKVPVDAPEDLLLATAYFWHIVGLYWDVPEPLGMWQRSSTEALGERYPPIREVERGLVVAMLDAADAGLGAEGIAATTGMELASIEDYLDDDPAEWRGMVPTNIW